jgi:hypothetical protein
MSRSRWRDERRHRHPQRAFAERGVRGPTFDELRRNWDGEQVVRYDRMSET